MSLTDNGDSYLDMAVESDPERVKELESGSEDEEKTWTGRGRYSKGVWYCDCDGSPRAKCRPAGQKAKPENRGRKYWSCAKKDVREACTFYLWVDDEPKAKAWQQRKYGILEEPGTPPKLDSSVNPFTLSVSTKRKLKHVSFAGEDANGGPVNQDEVLADFEDIPSPSRKASKASRHDTPSQLATDRLKVAANSLPSPDSERKSNGKGPSRTANDTISLGAAIELNDERPSNLATAVIELLRSEDVHLKESTQLQIRHELDLATDRHEAEVRRYKQTISEYKKRLDQFENLYKDLGVKGIDEEVDLSD